MNGNKYRASVRREDSGSRKKTVATVVNPIKNMLPYFSWKIAQML